MKVSIKTGLITSMMFCLILLVKKMNFSCYLLKKYYNGHKRKVISDEFTFSKFVLSQMRIWPNYSVLRIQPNSNHLQLRLKTNFFELHPSSPSFMKHEIIHWKLWLELIILFACIQSNQWITTTLGLKKWSFSRSGCYLEFQKKI